MDTEREGQATTLRLHQSVARTLGIAIVSGRYAPGDNLGGEIEQSEVMGVSRTAYREAIRILVAKGLVESRPKAGTHVTARHRWNFLDPQILEWMFSGEPDQRFIQDLFELRGVIEPAAAALAAARRTPEQLASMRAALDAMAHHGLAAVEGREADQHFHRAILQAAGNEALASLASTVGAAVTWTTRFKQENSTVPRDPVPDHEAVWEAIAAGDAGAARAAMHRLLTLALDDMGVASS